MKCSWPFKKIAVLLSIALSGMFQRVAAQVPGWQMAQAVATATAEASGIQSEVGATAVDGTGNVFIVGSFSNKLTLGSTILTSFGGSSDVFVAKFNPVSEQFVWAQRLGVERPDFARAVVVSGNSVYVAGSLGSPDNRFGYTDAFVAMFTDEGNTGRLAWEQRAGSKVDGNSAYALAVSGNSVYVAGEFFGTAEFGSLTLTGASTPAPAMFVAKLIDEGSTGRFVWAQQVNGRAYALAASGSSVYIAGFFIGTANFGPITLSSRSSDAFVAKLTDAGSTGRFVWAQEFGGLGYESAYALAVSGNNVYVAGEYQATASFGSVTLISAGANDMFVAKLTDTGSVGWVHRAGGSGDDRANALIVSGNNVYAAGDFNSVDADFGSATLISAGASDVFVTKLTDAGSTASFEWVQRAGGTGVDKATTLSLNGIAVYVGGSFSNPTATFGNFVLTNPYPSIYSRSPVLMPLGFLAYLTDPTLSTTERTLLFPNPAHSSVVLRLHLGAAPMPLTLTNALGCTVRNYPAPPASHATLDLQGLPAGLYLLRGAGPTQRLVVE